ncbi:hypothetical protein ACKUSY_12280 [Myroides odoratus]
MRNEPDYELFFFLIFLTVILTNVGYSSAQKHLRKNKVFYPILILSILGVVYAAFQIEIGWQRKSIFGILSPLFLFFYLVLYKLVDRIAYRMYNRHIYFSCKVSSFLGEKEATEATWLETFMQIGIIAVSLISWNKVIEWVTLYCATT